MIEDKEYIKLVKLFYSFLESEFDYTISDETIKGNAFYDIEYRSSDKVISISYENIEDNLEIIVFLLQKGELPDYDDKSKTLHLGTLNSQIFSVLDTEDIRLNSERFSKYISKDKLSKKLLKEAMELRLCLIHFDKRKITM